MEGVVEEARRGAEEEINGGGKQGVFWSHVWAPLIKVLEREGMRTRCALNARVGAH